MNYVVTIVDPKSAQAVTEVCDFSGLPMTVMLIGHGTASKNILDLLGIESTEKRIIITVAPREKSKHFIKELKKKLYIGIPGRGIIVSIPIKSVGGGNTVSYLSGDSKPTKKPPKLNFAYELIVAISNEGRTGIVMDAARLAGATGGTVLHGKGTASPEQEKFLNVSIGREKEVILIVAKASQKAAIMKSVLENAGPDTEAGAIVFSLPISDIAGIAG